MNLNQVKELAVQLIDEYSLSSPPVTDDEDIDVKLNNLVQAGQVELSLICKIKKLFKFDITEQPEGMYTEITLPDNFMELNKIRGYNKNETIIISGYYIQEDGFEKILKIPRGFIGSFELEYNAIPEMITTETDDTHKLELDIAAQEVLAYYVAADILKSDPSADYTSFEAKYNAKVEVLMQNVKPNTSITIEPLFGNI